MNKEIALPVNETMRGLHTYWGGCKAQRDADWERIKPLLEAVREALECGHCDRPPCVNCTALLLEAYKQLPGEKP